MTAGVNETQFEEKHERYFRIEKRNCLLLIPFALYITLAGLYLAIIPSGESPDEGGHVQCIEQVSRFNRLPIVEPKPEGISWSRTVALSGILCYHTPLYYLGVGYLQRGIAEFAGVDLHYEFPPTNPNGPSPAMFIHAPLENIWALEEPPTMSGSRILSILLWGIMVVLVYVIAAILWPQWYRLRLIAVTILAGWPQFLFMSRAINNDALALPLVTIVLAILLKVGNPGRLVWAAIIASLAILGKLTVAFGLIVVIATWVVEVVSYPSKRTDYLRLGVVIFIIISALVGLLYFQPVLNEHVLATTLTTSGRHPESNQLNYWWAVFSLTLESGFVRYGMMNIAAPIWQTWVWWLFIGVGLIVGAAIFIRKFVRSAEGRIQIIIILLWITGNFALYFRINLNRFQPQFRYLFGLLPIFTLFTGIGYSWLTRKVKQDFVVVLLIALVLFGLNVWILRQVVLPSYWPGLY